MSIRARLLLLFPLLFVLVIGVSGGIALDKIERQQLSSQETTINAQTLLLKRFFRNHGLKTKDSSATLAADIGQSDSPLERWGRLRTKTIQDSFDLIIFEDLSNESTAWWAKNNWLDFDNEDKSFLPSLRTQYGWDYFILGKEPIAIGYAPVFNLPSDIPKDDYESWVLENSNDLELIGTLALGVRVEKTVIPDAFKYLSAEEILYFSETKSPDKFNSIEVEEIMGIVKRTKGETSSIEDWVREEIVKKGIWAIKFQAPYAIQGFPLVGPNSGQNKGAVVVVSNMSQDIAIGEELSAGMEVLLVITVLIAVVIAIILGRSISRPIRSLADAVEDLKPGREVRIKVKKEAKDEVSILGRSIFSMHKRIETQVNELETLNDQVSSAYESKSRFLSTMSHELRTPLNAIIGFAEILKEKSFGKLSERQDEFVQNINESANHLLALINDILDLSRSEVGKTKANPERVELREIFESILRELEVIADRQEISLSSEIEGPAQVWIDPRHARQILTNLISNAVKYNEEKGRVDIKVYPNEDPRYLTISILDTGLGIPENEQSSIFDAFTRAKSTDRSAVSGTGLGLALVKQLAELNKGDVYLNFSSEEKGTEFHLILPVIDFKKEK